MNLNFDIDFDQLKELDFNDAGSWPKPIKGLAIAIVCVAVLFAGYWFDIRNQLDVLERAEKKEADLKENYRVKQMKAINLDAYKEQMVEMERSFGAMLRQLPSKTEVAELLVDISQAGLANGLEFELFKPLSESPAEFYSELPVDIKVTGNYHDFGKFVSDVAALPRIVTLHDINVSPAAGSAKGKDKNKDNASRSLQMSLQAKTYRYLEAE